MVEEKEVVDTLNKKKKQKTSKDGCSWIPGQLA